MHKIAPPTAMARRIQRVPFACCVLFLTAEPNCDSETITMEDLDVFVHFRK